MAAEFDDDDDMLTAKVVLLGSTLVGKTTLATRATRGQFDPSITPTIGASYASTVVTVGSTSIKLQIWDTAGQERFKTLVPMYFRGAVAAVVVFSLIDPLSLRDVDFWANAVRQSATPPPAIFVAANKLDLGDARKVTIEEGEIIARRYDAEYWEISAKSGHQIEEMTTRIAEVGITRIRNAALKRPTSMVEIVDKIDTVTGKKTCCS
jgi:small GTP-binding protein